MKLKSLFILSIISLLADDIWAANVDFDATIAQLGLKDNVTTDWSDSAEIKLPEPTLAYVNILSPEQVMPQSPQDLHNVEVEMYDGQGNYFRKRAVTHAQGSTSLSFEKKSFAANFCDDEWLEKTTPNIKFGNWVGQDAFHFKAYWIDAYRGLGNVCYQLYDQMTESRGEAIWQRVGHDGEHNKAKCYPMGFPCVVYLNGKFEGVFVWQLKKHRKNMNMKKDVAEEIHLDGMIDNTSLLVNSINWTFFEVRNPKDLYLMDGSLYDGDAPLELMDETSAYYNLPTDTEKVRNRKVRTAQVKKYIKNLSTYYTEIQSMNKAKRSADAIRQRLAEQIDVDGFIDYYLLCLVTGNYDGFRKNWQWFTYDGIKWCLAPYDLDCTFGNLSQGTAKVPAEYSSLGDTYKLSSLSTRGDMYWVLMYYTQHIRKRYAELRDQGIFSSHHIYSMIQDWTNRIGDENYGLEKQRWPNCPSFLQTECNPNWAEVDNFDDYIKLPAWDSQATYHAGTKVTYKYRIWQATGTTTPGVQPFKVIGTPESMERLASWIEKRLELEDAYLEYNPDVQPITYNLNITGAQWCTLCLPFDYTLPEGVRAFTIDSFDPNTQMLNLASADLPQANKPYLVYGPSGSYTLSGQMLTNSSSQPLRNGLLTGVYTQQLAPVNSFVLQDKEHGLGFYRTVENQQPTIKPYRAYLTYDEGDNMQRAAYFFDHQEGNSTNGIEMPYEESTFFEQAGFTHPEGMTFYSVSGQPLSGPRPGINIVRYPDGRQMKINVK